MERRNLLRCLLLSVFMVRMILGATITINLNDSILLDHNNQGISTIGQDFEGNFFVCYQDSSAERYSSNFSTHIDLTFPQKVESLQTRSFSMPTVNLSNGTSFSMSSATSRNIMVLSHNMTRLRDYNYFTYANPYTYNVNDYILSEIGYAFTVSAISQYYHLLICQKTVKMLYAGTTINQLSFGTLFGTNTVVVAAICAKSPVSVGGDYINANFVYYVSLSNNNVYQFNIAFSFKFNFTIDHYSVYNFSYTNSIIYSSPSPINSLLVASSLLLMQANSTGHCTIYNANTSQLGATSNIPTDQNLRFLTLLGKFYLLQSTGMSIVDYNSTTNVLSYGSLTSALANNTYNFVWGPYIAPFYTPGQPYIYKGGLCGGQSFMNGTSCVNYSCLVDNCTSCNVSPYLCSACQDGFAINSNKTCDFIPTPTIIDNMRESFAFLEEPITNAKQILSDTISFPATRRLIAPFFAYFGIFDDLYLFQFHDRLYGTTMNSLFNSINDIQSKKWSFLNYQEVLRFMQADPGLFFNVTDYQDAYSYYQFKDSGHTYVGPEGVWGNCQNFFVVACPITIVMFLLLRWLFKLLYRFPVSKLLRNFEFWPFLFVLLMEGNIQQIGFYMVTDWKNMFYFDNGSKWIKTQIIFFGFAFFVMTVSLYYLSYGLYQRLNSYLMENNLNNLKGQTLFILQSGFKNLYFGVMHSLLRSLPYNLMLSILFVNEVAFFSIFLAAMVKRSYKSVLKMWIYTILNFLKILQMITLYFDYDNINVPTIQAVQLILISLEVGIFFIGGFIEAVTNIKECIYFIKNLIISDGDKVIQQNTVQQSRFLEHELSHNNVVIYVKNLSDQPKRHQFKIRRFGFQQGHKPPPINIRVSKDFSSFQNFALKPKKQNKFQKSKHLRINFTNPNLLQVEPNS